MELDNHVDTCAVGSKSALVIRRHDKQIDVLGYQGSTGDTQTLQGGDAAVVYERFKGERIMLIINQALEVPGHNINLLSPMQVRMNDVEVREQPKFTIKNPTDRDHAITIEDEDICTKVIPAGPKRDNLINLTLYDLNDEHGGEESPKEGR